jgi:23S rRNA pseudouridine1911/1915/1917 synthase
MAFASRESPDELTVLADEAGLRLDAFLVRRGLAPSAAAARRILADPRTQVKVDGRPSRKGERLQAAQLIDLQGSLPAGSGSRAIEADATLRLDVLYLDEALVAVNKPAGIASHPLRPGERGTVASALVASHPECSLAAPDPREGGLVHRLDVGTSGVLVAARRRDLWTPLHETLVGGACEKVYLAEVSGRAEGTVIEAPIGRVGRRGDRVRVGAGRALMPARTEVAVRSWRAETTLVEARLARGRPHQVRAHLAHLGWPVLGDAIYGEQHARALAQALAVQHLRLHAWSVRFLHPLTAEWVRIEAPPPAWGAG